MRKAGFGIMQLKCGSHSSVLGQSTFLSQVDFPGNLFWGFHSIISCVEHRHELSYRVWFADSEEMTTLQHTEVPPP